MYIYKYTAKWSVEEDIFYKRTEKNWKPTCFSRWSVHENDIVNKLDKKAVEKAKEETGLKYTNQEIVYKNKKPAEIKLYVCDLQTMRI